MDATESLYFFNCSLKVKNIALPNKSFQSHGASHAMWDHTVLG